MAKAFMLSKNSCDQTDTDQTCNNCLLLDFIKALNLGGFIIAFLSKSRELKDIHLESVSMR